MAEENKTKKKTNTPKTPSPLVGRRAIPTVLDNKVKIDVDIDNTLEDQLVAASLTQKVNYSEIDRFSTISDNRNLKYQQIDIMFQDASVSAIARTFAQEACEPSDNGHVIWAESPDPKISKCVNYLLNVSNIDDNIYGWTFSLIKYGEVFLKLYRDSDYEDRFFSRQKIDSVMQSRKQLQEDIILHKRKFNDNYSYYIEMIPDPSTMFEVNKYGQTFGYVEVPNEHLSSIFEDSVASIGSNTLPISSSSWNYKLKEGDIIIHQADDYVHAVLDDNVSRFPETVELIYDDDDEDEKVKNKNKLDKKYGASSNLYEVKSGKSMFYDAYKVWREKQLLEASALLCRITRSNIIQKVQVEVGSASKEKSALTLRAVKEMFEQRTSFSDKKSMSEYTNPGPIINYIYQATRGGQGNISVESIGGDYDPKSLVDLDWWNNKFYSMFGIPKQYYGWTEDNAGFNGGTSLSIQSSVFAKGVRHIQNAMIQAIDRAINLFLLQAGYRSYMHNFVIKMKPPVTQEELNYRENLGNRINAISSMNSLFQDVETKSRRIEILKELVATLNYGDRIGALLDEEIQMLLEKEEKDRLAAEKAEEEEANNPGAEVETPNEGEKESGGDEGADVDFGDLNVDMDSVPVAADTPTESFSQTNDNAEVLFESTDLNADSEDKNSDDSIDDLLEDAETDLPSPEELDSEKDFTKNE